MEILTINMCLYGEFHVCFRYNDVANVMIIIIIIVHLHYVVGISLCVYNRVYMKAASPLCFHEVNSFYFIPARYA